MLTLLAALALNIPGNPTKFQCEPVHQGSASTTQCIRFENQYPKYRITFTCDNGYGIYASNGAITVFPSASTVISGATIYICTINKVDIL